MKPYHRETTLSSLKSKECFKLALESDRQMSAISNSIAPLAGLFGDAFEEFPAFLLSMNSMAASIQL